MRLADFSSVLEALYDAGSDPAKWPQFLARLRKTVGASHAYLLADRPEGMVPRFLLEGYRAEDMKKYAEYYCQSDVPLQRTQLLLQQHGQWTGLMEQVWSKAEMNRTEIYCDYMRPAGLESQVCTAQLGVGPYSAVGVALWRGKQSKAFTSNESHILELLQPHLRAALLMNAGIERSGEDETAFIHSLNLHGVAAIAVDARMNVVALSAEAERYIQQGETLKIRNRRVHAVQGGTNASLAKLVQQASEASEISTNVITDGERAPNGSVAAWRVSRPPLHIHVYPLRVTWSAKGRKPTAILFLDDPARMHSSTAAVMRDLYGLTPVECRICTFLFALVEVKEMPELFGISLPAVQYHFKQIYLKTGTVKQSGLMRLLTSVDRSLLRSAQNS